MATLRDTDGDSTNGKVDVGQPDILHSAYSSEGFRVNIPAISRASSKPIGCAVHPQQSEHLLGRLAEPVVEAA
jgi:hypothetical protein